MNFQIFEIAIWLIVIIEWFWKLIKNIISHHIHYFHTHKIIWSLPNLVFFGKNQEAGQRKKTNYIYHTRNHRKNKLRLEYEKIIFFEKTVHYKKWDFQLLEENFTFSQQIFFTKIVDTKFQFIIVLQFNHLVYNNNFKRSNFITEIIIFWRDFV